MGRPRAHTEETAEALLDAAEALLARSGPEKLAVRDVADAVGVTTRAVYSLFGSKAGLVEGLAARGYRLLADYVDGLPVTDDPGADLVAAGLHGFRRFATERPHLFRLTFERVPAEITATETTRPAARASYEALLARIRRARAAGLVDDRPDVDAAFAFHSLCQGLAGGELSREPPPIGSRFWGPARDVPAERLWRGALEALVKGMAPQE